MDPQLDDAALWATARGGDGDAFATLFHRHVHAVYNYCFRRCGSWSRAVDLVPVVFRETWRRRNQLDVEGGSVLPYLLGTANAVAAPSGPALWRRQRAPVGSSPSPGDRPDVDDEARMRAAIDVIRRLPRVEQDAVALCGWQGLTEGEAALAMNVPVETVTAALVRADERTGGTTPTADALPAEREPTGVQVEKQSARLAGKVATRHRSMVVVAAVSGAVALAITLAGVYLIHKPVDDTSLVRCFTAATLDHPGIYLSRMDDSGGDLTQLHDPVSACRELWAQGVLVADNPRAQAPSASAKQAVPELTACELDETSLGPIVAVVPGGPDVCESLRLRRWAGT